MDKLIRSRRNYLGQVTRFRNFLDTIDKDNFDAIAARVRYDSFVTLRDKFDNVQTDIEITCDMKDLDVHTKERLVFEEEYFRVDTMYRRIVEECVQSNSFRSINNPPPENVRLPTIDIPKFNGDITTFRSYKHVFSSLIDDNEQLSKTQKFLYLRGSLSGDAFDLVSALELSDDNYDAAIILLDSRYNNKRSIIQAHINALFDFPVIKHYNVSTLHKLIDSFTKHLSALKSLDEPVEEWSSLLVFILLSKLDKETREAFELDYKEMQMPKYSCVISFLRKRCNSLDSFSKSLGQEKFKNPKTLHTTATELSTRSEQCVSCGGVHKIRKCPGFMAKSPKSRFEFVKMNKLCINCLNGGHVAKDCKSRLCSKCGKRHNDLLHFESLNSGEHSIPPIADQKENSTDLTVQGSSLHSVSQSSSVLLYTAVVQIKDVSGRFRLVRGIIDPGSQINVVTASLAKKLKLNTRPVCGNVEGFGGNSQPITKYIEIVIRSNVGDFTLPIQAFVCKKITDDLPRTNITADDSFVNLQLADPSYNNSGEIDFLLSNAVYSSIVRPGLVNSKNKKLKAVNTEFGYVVGGIPCSLSTNFRSVSLSIITDIPRMEDNLEKFWAVEDIPTLTSEQDICEDTFVKTTFRDFSGSFCVKLPFVSESFDFSHSRKFAYNRLISLERKFRRNSNFKSLYVDFMREYLSLGHMIRVNPNQTAELNSYYIPHHGILKSVDGRQKIRVVFDGSSSPDGTSSLNDLLYAGPKLQNDLVAILMRFRFYRFGFSTDIAKMYRMIKVQECHQGFQKILWRENEDDSVQEFRLTTVTYGLKSSPYLALRCIRQLALEYNDIYPRASSVLSLDTFVDDIVSGFNSIEDGLSQLVILSRILNSANFVLHKWHSNSAELISPYIGSSNNSTDEINYDNHAVLGVRWNPKLDNFSYSYNLNVPSLITKRVILSQLSGIFDPLGWISPCVIVGKILMQELWKLKLDWDEEVCEKLKTEWIKYVQDLSYIKSVSVPRYLGVTFENSLELFGFCDASLKAYGACIYIRVDRSFYLIVSKSRVAPVRREVGVSAELSIAKLELLGALTLCRLMKYTRENCRAASINCQLFTDSQIVLAWLAKPASTWKQFVANRVLEIQNSFDRSHWKYIESVRNPADLISRGCSAKNLSVSELWWNGPENFATSDLAVETNLELKKSKPKILNLSLTCLSRFSSYRTCVRVVAYMIRFCTNLRLPDSARKLDEISMSELLFALDKIVFLLQHIYFRETIEYLKRKGVVRNNDPLRSLTPFLDKNGLLRVGGRLSHANIAYSAKHPLILPKSDHFVELLIDHEHRLNEHANVDTLVTILRQRFWILHSRSVVRRVVRRCFRCFRTRPIPTSQMMGDLPISRVELVRPFINVGIDFCGPFKVRPHKGRGNTTFKIYVAVFVCMGVKAVHLEVVGDLTTASFIASFRRFIARRGKPKEVWTDNGTNFTGASNLISNLSNLIGSDGFQNSILELSRSELIKWNFIPPRSPSFGGLWERTVRSFKTIFYKISGTSVLSLEEFNTLVVQVEASLNSRPICQILNETDNLDVLTPGHFLIGHHLKSISCSVSETNDSLSVRWKRVQDIFRQFWDQWHKQYLQTLQSRYVRQTKKPNIKIGDVGVLVNENLSPLKWPLAKVKNVFPGSDGLVRVIEVQVGQSIYKRGVQKFCPLPSSHFQ